jgi:hypothetical protein
MEFGDEQAGVHGLDYNLRLLNSPNLPADRMPPSWCKKLSDEF